MADNLLICFGDSITDCGRLWDAPPLGDGYVSMLFDKLNSDKSTSWNIINKGIDGFTIARVLEQLRDEPRIYSADAISVLIGINDIGLMMNTDRTPAQIEDMFQVFVENYREMLRILSGTHKKILLMEPFIFPWPSKYQIWIPYVDRMSKEIAALAKEFQIPYIYLNADLLSLAEQIGIKNATIDGIHLTQPGHALLADYVYKKLI